VAAPQAGYVWPTFPPEPSPTPSVTGEVVGYPTAGHGAYRLASGPGPVVGRSGDVLRYQIAVETDISGLDLDAFAAIVEQTYGEPQGWTANGEWRLQRVGPGQPTDFVLYLVTPATRDVLCQDGYDRYTSCRNGNRVVLNVARWVHGVPAYGQPLDIYRQYMINHETGHRLGFGHELCPGAGQPAPVMQQQTLGLHGCVANAWPMVNGRPYHGDSGNYAA
jgi:hypothetical protein